MEKLEIRINDLIKEIELFKKQFTAIHNKYNLRYSIEEVGEVITLSEYDYDVEDDSIISINLDYRNTPEIWYNYTKEITDLLFDKFLDLKESTLFLIELLDKEKQIKYKKKVNKLDIEFIQKKKYITVKEFTGIYNMSRETQQRRRGRLYDPLPFRKEGNKIYYEVKEIENWLENQN